MRVTVLIVEDQEKHRSDRMRTLKEIRKSLPILDLVPIYAETLTDALELLPQAQAVVTDVFFPVDRGGEEEASGKVVVEECLKNQIPVVWITSTYHHGERTQEVYRWGCEHGLFMFDCYVDGDEEGAHKPWKDAIISVLVTMAKVKEGKLIYDGDKIVGEFLGEDCAGAYYVSYFMEEIIKNGEIDIDKFMETWQIMS